MKTQAMIVEDNSLDSEILCDLLHDKHPYIDITVRCESVREAEMQLKKVTPDLIFLDVELPDDKGTSLIDGNSKVDCEWIFTTSHEKYAVEAFKYNALDYLVKPYSEIDLSRALLRYCKSISRL